MKKNRILLSLLISVLCLSGCHTAPAEEETLSETQQQISATTEISEEAIAYTDASSIQLLGSLIEEQTFEVSLNSWGTVTFVSTAPDGSAAEEQGLWPDARFYLLQNSFPIYEFPGWNEEHRTGDRFLSVDAVAFRDYNNDSLLDVITICQYETESDSAFHTARVYFQLENNQGFEEDTLLTEYLSKQHCADTVAAVMRAKADYWDYLSAMDGHRSAYHQMQVIAQNTALWIDDPSYANDICRYAVVDLDRNGRYEIIVSNMGGTGQYTYSRFFEVNDSYDGLKACETGFLEGHSQPDLIVEVLDTYINSNGEFYYAVHDLTKNGAAEYYETVSALTLKNGCVTTAPIAYKSTIYTEGTPNVTCQNANGVMISEADYEEAVSAYFSGWSKTITRLGWQDMEELRGSPEEITARLSASFDVYFTSE